MSENMEEKLGSEEPEKLPEKVENKNVSKKSSEEKSLGEQFKRELIKRTY